MTREEAIQVLQTALTAPFIYGNYAVAIEMAIEALSAEQKWIPCSKGLPKELDPVNVTWVNHNPPFYYINIKDVPFTATGVYHDGKWYWWDATITDLLGEYDGAYVHGIEPIDKYIEITAWMPLPKPYKGGDTANCTTEKPNDEVEQGNDIIDTQTDLISRADVIEAVENLQTEQWIDSDIDYNNGLQSAIAEIKAFPSSDRPTELLKDGTLKVNVNNGAEVNRVLVWGDDGCGGLYYADDRPSGEWIPCSERLPKEKARVLTYDSMGDIVFGQYDKGRWYWEAEACADYWAKNDGVIAWMPLPKPYCPNCGAKMGSDKK